MASIHFDITGDNKQVLQSLKQTMEAITNLEKKTNTAGKNVQTGFKGMGQTISSELRGMALRFVSITAAVGLFVRTIKQAVTINKDFERKNSELASVLGTTKTGVSELSKAAQELGRTTEFTSTEVTELQIALARLGFQKNQILEMQGTVLKFAAAVNADLGRAANFAGAALRGFGLQAKDTEHLLDVMAAATTKSALDFSKLETSMSIVAPIAHAFGLSVEDAVTLLGALSNAGFDASSAATATRNILLNLADANGKLAKGLGHTARTFPEIIEALKECNAKGIDLNATLEMTDKRSVSAFNALISGAASADELREALGNVDGTLDEMYKTMTDNVAGGIKQVQSAWEGLILTMQDSTGPLARILKQFARGLNVITDLAQGMSLKDIRTKQRGEYYLNGNYTLEQLQKMRDDEMAKLNDPNYAVKDSNTGKKLGRAAQKVSVNGQKGIEKRVDALNYAIGRMIQSQQESVMDSVIAELEAESGNKGGSGKKNLTDEEKKEAKRRAEQMKEARKRLEDDLNALILSNEQARIDLMDEGSKKEIDTILQNYEKGEEELRKLKLKWAEENKKAGYKDVNSDGLTEAQQAAMDIARQRNQEARDKAFNEQTRRNREEYLKEYGNYEERKLAITEEYNRKIAASGDDIYKKASITKEFEKDINDLKRQFDSAYSLIFSDASLLTDNALIQAIKATQEEIRRAETSGDIQALTDLYDKLREKLNEQTKRNAGWGFMGIGEGFKLLDEAELNRARAELARRGGGSKTEIDKYEQDSINNREQGLELISQSFQQLSKAFGELGEALSKFDGALGKFGQFFQGMSDSSIDFADTFSKAFSGTMNKGQAISTAISGTLELVGMIGDQIAQNKEYQKQWNATVKQTAHEFAMLQLESLDYKESNLFGIENPYKKAIDGAKQYSAAMEELNKLTSQIAGGQVQTGTKKAVNWKNVGKGAAAGAAAGAAVGTFFGPIGTAIGAAAGALTGVVAGLFSTKRVAVYESLADKYSYLYDEQMKLNPQIIADYDKMDDETKQLIDNWDEIVSKAKEAEEQMRETFKSLAGNIGDQLSDSLVDAFTNGDVFGAVDDFKGKVEDTIEDILEQLIFSAAFEDLFKNLEDEMFASFGSGGDQDIVDDIMRFMDTYPSRLAEYEQAMKDAKESMAELGYNLWSPDASERTGLSQGIATASQDSIDALSGMMTVVQGHTFEIKESLTGFSAQYETLIANTAAMLEHTQGIHVDTTEIKEIQAEIAQLSRSISSNVSTIVDRGVTMRG